MRTLFIDNGTIRDVEEHKMEAILSKKKASDQPSKLKKLIAKIFDRDEKDIDDSD
jgi:hypothetical protein